LDSPYYHPRLYPVTLGCAKNRVDTEVMLARLTGAGWRIVADPEEADLILVNTCGFIASAAQEAVDTILELAAVKQNRPGTLLVAAGCLVQRHRESLPELLPEVDAWVGVNDFPDIVGIVAGLTGAAPGRHWDGPLLSGAEVSPRLLTTPFYTAYVKIAEGCSHRCTFCTIPAIRGPFRSRPAEVIVQEAELLLSRGVIELNLVAQDTTGYGREGDQRSRLPELLEKIAGLPGLAWLRLLYSHPLGITPELLDVMAAHPKICPYLDLPLQHLADPVLKRMGRRYTQRQALEVIDRIRRRLPGAALRTSVITGFPGESEADFAELCRRVEEIGFDHLGIFAFQPEEGTPAARYPDQVPARTGARRARQLTRLQARLRRKQLRALKGTVQEVLVEGVSEETELLLTGRLATQAPEVDGQVYITAGQGMVGQLQKVRLTRTHTYDLEGELVDDADPEGREDR